MKKPYRCQNSACSTDPHGRLIFNFWAEQPVCPKCGCDLRTTEGSQVIVGLEITHFDPPHAVIKGTPLATHKGTGFRACDAEKAVGMGHASGNPSVVNCPECRETEAWKKAAEEWGVEVVKPEADFAIGVKGGVIEKVE